MASVTPRRTAPRAAAGARLPPLSSELVAERDEGLLAIRPRLAMSHQERLRYFENIAKHRPYELELLTWNHDRPREGEEAEDYPEHLAFEQLQCLTGEYRYTLSGKNGGGVEWMHVELAGVFLRHRSNAALLWLPEAGPNFLLQAAAGEPWLLLEVARLGKEAVVVERTARGRATEAAIYGNVAIHRAWHERVRQHDASPHLTDQWLQAAEDLRAIWSWDWRPVRPGSPFELACAKFVYTVGYPLADKFVPGRHGEERWLWHWQEDGRGKLLVVNRSWQEEAQMSLSDCEAVYEGLGGERLVWSAAET